MKSMQPSHSSPTFPIRLLAALALFASALTVPAQFIMTNLWSISTTNGDPYTYINTDGSQRGIAYNPTTNHVYVVSRTGSAQVYVLDGDTGAHIGQLDVTGVSGGGGGAINLVDCTEDGQIYICNLATAEGTFRLYRYADEASAPVLVFVGDPSLGDTNAPVTNSKRFGDNLAVRGTGTNVQVLVHSRGGRASGLLFPADETMTTFLSQVILTDAANGDLGVGAAWDNGNSFWSKAPARPLRRLQIVNEADIYNTSVALVATTAVNVALTPTTTSGLHSLPASNLLAVIDYGGHTLRLYDTSSGTGVALQDSRPFPPPSASNGNGTGEPAFGLKNGAINLYGVDSNNGLLATRLVRVTAPIISGGPSDTTILDGGYGSLNVVANGSPPLVYLWYFNTNTLVTVATNEGSLSLTNVTAANAGYYRVVVTNAAGSSTSADALLTIAPTVRSLVMEPIWRLPGGSRPYLSTSDLTRGMAVNPANGHVLVVTRVGGANIHVLDGDTGADLWTMNTDPTIVTGSAPGGFALNMIGVADDGVVYACNLNTGGAATKIYRWDNDAAATVPVVISESDPTFSTGRFGDTMKVRGAGLDTQILLRAQAADLAVLLTTWDGFNFFASPLYEDATDSTRLGLAFGTGNTYWSKGVGNLVQFEFDINTQTATTLVSITNTLFPNLGHPIGVDPRNEFLARLATFAQTPDNVGLYDISGAAQTNAPVLLDQEFMASDNGNINAVGDVSFDLARGRVVVLENNNGLLALKYAPRLRQEAFGSGNILSWDGPGVLQSSTNVNGTYVDTPATSPHTNTAAGQLYFRVRR